MPTFKHSCPHCGTFINRDAAACPACGRADPFAPARCPNCRATIEDPSWIACPACGKPVGAAAVAAAAAASANAGASASAGARPEAALTVPGLAERAPAERPASTVKPAAPEIRGCSGCGAPLPAGARFCRECGTASA